MADRSAREDLFNANVRAGSIIAIEAAGFGDSPIDRFEEMVEGIYDRDDPDASAVLSAVPALRALWSDEDIPDAENVEDAIISSGLTGFFVHAETPVFRPLADGGFSTSWGRYHTEWIYIADASLLAQSLIAWAEARHAKDKSANSAEPRQ